MNDTQLENAIRAELAADAARTPVAESTKLAVRAAVAGLPSAGQGQALRRWLLPTAVAAVLVALLVAGFLVPKALSSHRARPATPQPSPSPSQPALPPAPVVALSCPSGQRTVDGLSAKLTDGNGAPRYAYEYFCAGADGSRGYSMIEVFRDAQGQLTRVINEPVGLYQSYLMSLAATAGGLKFRSYDLSPYRLGGPDGTVEDILYPVGSADSSAEINIVAGACTTDQLSVSQSESGEPVPHTVLTLTNTSANACSVWGTPKYTVVGTVPATVRYLLNGPAGGAEGLPSSPPLLVQPGHSVSASVGNDPLSGNSCHEVEGVRAVLPNGVSLGTLDLGVCGNMVGYPFVDSPNGSLTHPESEAPVNKATGSCVDNVETVIELGTFTATVNHRRHDVITIRPSGKAHCTLTGYADIRELSPSGVLQAIARQTPSGPAGGIAGLPAPTVTVSPGRPASILVEWSDNGQSCVPSGQISLRLGGGTYTDGSSTGPVCDLQVHPFVAGATGSG